MSLAAYDVRINKLSRYLQDVVTSELENRTDLLSG